MRGEQAGNDLGVVLGTGYSSQFSKISRFPTFARINREFKIQNGCHTRKDR